MAVPDFLAELRKFKTRLRVLVRDASQLADSFLSASLHILAERISDGGLTPTTDTNLLLATYRSGSHLTSDISHTSLHHITLPAHISQETVWYVLPSDN